MYSRGQRQWGWFLFLQKLAWLAEKPATDTRSRTYMPAKVRDHHVAKAHLCLYSVVWLCWLHLLKVLIGRRRRTVCVFNSNKHILIYRVLNWKKNFGVASICSSSVPVPRRRPDLFRTEQQTCSIGEERKFSQFERR